MSTHDQLFEAVVVVSLRRNQKAGAEAPEAFVSYQFPPNQDNAQSLVDTVSQFCFPEAKAWLELAESGSSSKQRLGRGEQFSFVLTSTDGSKKFGYCRRFAVPASSEEQKTFKFKLIPECFVILTSLPAEGFFCEMLDIIEDRRKSGSSAQVFQFLKAVTAKHMPSPGETLTVRTFDNHEYSLTRPEVARSMASFARLLKLLPVPVIMNLFSSVVNEDRVIVVSSHVSRLSTIVGSMNGLLFPFSWQHIYIPVLPRSLVAYCTAPMPFFVGMLRDDLSELERYPMETCAVIDADADGKLLKEAPEHWDYTNAANLPSEPAKTLRTRLESISKKGFAAKTSSALGNLFRRGRSKETKDTGDDVDMQTVTQEENAVVSQYFLEFFGTVLSGIEQHLNASHRLDRQTFFASRIAAHQQFMEGFQATQIFEMFIKELEQLHADGKMSHFALSGSKLNALHGELDVVVSPLSPAQQPRHGSFGARTQVLEANLNLSNGQPSCTVCGTKAAAGGTTMCSSCAKKKKRSGFMSMLPIKNRSPNASSSSSELPRRRNTELPVVAESPGFDSEPPANQFPRPAARNAERRLSKTLRNPVTDPLSSSVDSTPLTRDDSFVSSVGVLQPAVVITGFDVSPVVKSSPVVPKRPTAKHAPVPVSRSQTDSKPPPLFLRQSSDSAVSPRSSSPGALISPQVQPRSALASSSSTRFVGDPPGRNSAAVSPPAPKPAVKSSGPTPPGRFNAGLPPKAPTSASASKAKFCSSCGTPATGTFCAKCGNIV